MDKNMISVDDLVRQRLSGGEEPERAGAWAQMNELLDKEMPQTRPGGLLWSRTLGVVAILLITTASVGAYKLYNTSNTSENNTGVTASSVSPVASTLDKSSDKSTSSNKPLIAANTAANISNIPTSTDRNITGTPGNNNTGNSIDNKTNATHTLAGAITATNNTAPSHQVKKTANNIVKNNITASDKKLIASNAPSGEKLLAASATRSKTAKTKVAAIAKNSKKQPVVSTAGVNGINDINANNSTIVSATTDNVIGNNSTSGSKKATDQQNLVAANDKAATTTTITKAGKSPFSDNNLSKKTAKNNKKINVTGNIGSVSGSNVSGDNKVAANTGNADNKSAAKTMKTEGSKSGIASTNKPGNKTVKAAGSKIEVAINNKSVKHTGLNNEKTKTKPVSVNHMALGSHTGNAAPVTSATIASSKKLLAANAVKNNTGNKAGVKKNTVQAKPAGFAGSSNASVAVAVDNVAKLNKKKKAAAANSKNGTASSSGSNASNFVRNTKRTVGIPGPGVPAKPEINNQSEKSLAAINMKKGKRVIEKMEIYQHLIKKSQETSSQERRYHLDTLSIEMLTEDLSTLDDNTTTVTKSTLKKVFPGSNAPNSGAANPAIAPGASAPAPANKPADAAKPKASSENKKGVSVIENLQAKFNDIKYNVASVQFTPGLIAGINGTFFGPSSFKGFQFGVAGNFVFDDHWSIMGELKYIHRINNNYTMNDNYNTYQYNPGMHAYEKDSFAHAYSFSTLHSFELPISVQYTKNKMTFFLGGNFAYTLGVNPSENPQIYPIPPSYVATPGSNGTPKFTPSDLEAARFGIGYLFGFAYKVASNIVLDVRNVQTVWDNANGAGSRIVSTQLYKSPSLQLSMIYRFGDKKDKE